MTEKQKAFAERLKRYSEHKSDMEYSSVMKKAQRDEKFEKMIQSMTIGRIQTNKIDKWNSETRKYTFDFSYKPKGE